ncbi:Uncharacterised protein [Vibrio cholerae]|nr:Uncharacterised protein [Vibrio cholerae]
MSGFSSATMCLRKKWFKLRESSSSILVNVESGPSGTVKILSRESKLTCADLCSDTIQRRYYSD